MKPETFGILAVFRGKQSDEITRLVQENETLIAERDRLRQQLEAAQIQIEALQEDIKRRIWSPAPSPWIDFREWRPEDGQECEVFWEERQYKPEHSQTFRYDAAREAFEDSDEAVCPTYPHMLWCFWQSPTVAPPRRARTR